MRTKMRLKLLAAGKPTAISPTVFTVRPGRPRRTLNLCPAEVCSKEEPTAAEDKKCKANPIPRPIAWADAHQNYDQSQLRTRPMAVASVQLKCPSFTRRPRGKFYS